MRTFLIASALSLLVACGGSSPAAGPNPAAPGPSTPGIPAQKQIAGRISDAITGAPVSGASVKVGGATAVVSGADGDWQVDVGADTTDRLLTTIAAAGFIRRETYISATSSAAASVSIDLLPDREPFSLGFYREMARDGFESPSDLKPIRRWTSNPKFYLNTMNPRTGRPLKGSEVEEIVLNIRDAVTQVTDGLLAAGDIESGAGERAQRLGTINIDITYEPDEDYCGTAFVGANPGGIALNYGRCASSCGGRALGAEVVAHEVGHALGFWHVRHGVMQATAFLDCGRVNFTSPERLHGGLVYRRPSGNLDMDTDPRNAASLAAPGESPFIRCPRGAF